MRYSIILLAGLILLGLGCVSQTQTNASNTPAPGTNTGTPTTIPPTDNGETNTGLITIDMKNIEFVPTTITLTAGQTLRFTNSDGFGHDVHIQQNGQDIFPKTEVLAGQSIDVTLDDAGTYELICDRHLPGMVGTITVNP